MKDNKNKTIRVRVTDNEYEKITTAASYNNSCNLSDYARQCLLPDDKEHNGHKRSNMALMPESIKPSTITNMKKILIRLEGHTEQISGNGKIVSEMMEDIESLWQLLN